MKGEREIWTYSMHKRKGTFDSYGFSPEGTLISAAMAQYPVAGPHTHKP